MSVPLLVSMVLLNIHREVIRPTGYTSDRFGVGVIGLAWEWILTSMHSEMEMDFSHDAHD